MGRKRRQFSNQFKFTVALEAVKGLKTINQIPGEYNVYPNQVSTRKRQLLANGPAVSTTVILAQSTNKPFARPNCTSRSAGSRWNWSG